MNKTIEERAKELKDDPFIKKHLVIIKAKTLEAQKDYLIQTIIEKMWGGLEMDSIQHFVETGKVSGSFYLALKKIMDEYAKKAIAGATEAQDDWKRVEDDVYLIEGFFWKDNWINEEPSYCFYGNRESVLAYLKQEVLENQKYSPTYDENSLEVSYKTDSRRNYLIRAKKLSPLPATLKR